MYRLMLVHIDDDDDHARDCFTLSDEGPWQNAEDALRFAKYEVGVPWIVIDHCGMPIGYGDRNHYYQLKEYE